MLFKGLGILNDTPSLQYEAFPAFIPNDSIFNDGSFTGIGIKQKRAENL